MAEELLDKAEYIGSEYVRQMEDVEGQRQILRERMHEQDLLRNTNDLRQVEEPTTCGVDGARVTEQMLANDLVSACAIALEGMTPPSELQHWPEPKYMTHLSLEPHHPDTERVATGVMVAMELMLARRAPHRIVMLDNSLNTPTIQLNQALSAAHASPELKVSEKLLEMAPEAISAYLSILSNRRADHAFVGIPKYTSNTEISDRLEALGQQDDRFLMSILLEAGEYTKPQPLQKPAVQWHIAVRQGDTATQSVADQACNELLGVHILYYKPNPQLPALRLETDRNTAENDTRLASLLSAIRGQSHSPRTMEPFPLFMADRMVKSLSPTMQALIGNTSAEAAINYQGPTSHIYHGLHSYRT